MIYMTKEHSLNIDDLSTHSVIHLQKELTAVQHSLEMLFIKNNSLEHLDITHGGGSAEDQAEYRKLHSAQHKIVAELDKRYALENTK